MNINEPIYSQTPVFNLLHAISANTIEHASEMELNIILSTLEKLLQLNISRGNGTVALSPQMVDICRLFGG